MLEGFQSDFQEILFDVQSMKSQIEDSRDFINTHQVGTYNRHLFLSFSVYSKFHKISSIMCGDNPKICARIQTRDKINNSIFSKILT